MDKDRDERPQIMSRAVMISTMDDGSLLTLSEHPMRDRIIVRITIWGEGGGLPIRRDLETSCMVELTKSQWETLLDCRYALDVDAAKPPAALKTVSEERTPLERERKISLEGAKSSDGGDALPPKDDIPF